jgi:DNA-binding response OmpR family regulator
MGEAVVRGRGVEHPVPSAHAVPAGSAVRHPSQLVPASRLLTDVWGPGYERSTNYLRFHMAKLRRKLEEDPSRPRFLLTEPGMGYRYQPDGVPPGRRP